MKAASPSLRNIGLGFALAAGVVPSAVANPVGVTVASGNATVQQNGSTLSIAASHNAVLNWSSFNIGAGETTSFIQPNAASVVWNRITDQNPSHIFGNLTANGYVVLFNQSGFYFGPDSVVKVGGLLVSTVPIAREPGAGGAMWQFDGPPPAASIINYGRIETQSGGSLYLVSEKVENHGQLSAPDGTIGLYAGKEVLVSERPDGRGISASVRLPSGSVDNQGQITGDAGSILLNARVVNQNGVVSANSVRERNGVIELVASDALNLGANSVIEANGDGLIGSRGGTVRLKSEGSFRDEAGSRITARGGSAGGDAGLIAISAVDLPEIRSTIDGSANSGSVGGSLVIDPTDIIIGTSGSDSVGGGTVGSGTGAATMRFNVNSAFLGLSQITLQATRDISLAASLQWNLPASTGINARGSRLTLQAGRNIVFGSGSKIDGGANWSVVLEAGLRFDTPTPEIQPGVGSIWLRGGATGSGSGSLETSAGSIALRAGQDVLLGGGFVRSGSGALSIEAVSGDIHAGTKSDSFDYFPFGYQASGRGVGGIATLAGGAMSLKAGNNITSLLPTTGTYGLEAANLSINAGGDVLGTFQVRNGSGTVVARNFGSATSPATLNLVSGSWDVTASQDINVREVRAPNGVFNRNRAGTTFNGQPNAEDRRIAQLFDYGADASVSLKAGGALRLTGQGLQRPFEAVPVVLPPKVSLSAGAGGIEIGNDLVVAPSALGSLHIETTAGGFFRSAPGGFYQLVMSDSGSPSSSTFANDHAAVPVHLATAADPVTVKVSGDVENLMLRMPKQIRMDIGGNARNFSFEGQNLTGSDITEIKVAGDYTSPFDRVFGTVSSTPNLTVIDPEFSTGPNLSSRLTYLPISGQLSFVGRMTEEQRSYLLNPMVRQYDSLGELVVDVAGNPVLASATFAPAAVINDLFARSQEIPTSPLAYLGLRIGGPGQFILSARNLDLGISKGIRSEGATGNPSLNSSLPGASIKLDLSGNLNLTASQIASFAGGGIGVTALGGVSVGSQEQFTSDDTPKGIFTSGGGDVAVVAKGNINVEGSRIAAFDGGNVRVVSTEGDINAGAGGLSSVAVFRTVKDPVTGENLLVVSTIPISGIGATTLRGTDSQLGNVTVEATKGNIVASKGGILQLAFNGNQAGAPQITLNAPNGNIDAGDSGVIGSNVRILDAKNVSGLFVASAGNLDINAQQNVNVTALATGGVAVKSDTASGTFVGSSSVAVSAGAISGSLVSGNVSASGDASAATTGVQSTSAAKSDSKVAADAAETVAEKKGEASLMSEDDEKKRQAARPKLSRSTGRVTVILPTKN